MIMNNKQGKYRIAYIAIAGIIFFLILIMTFAPDSQQITGNSIAENKITGKIAAKSIFAVSTKNQNQHEECLGLREERLGDDVGDTTWRRETPFRCFSNTSNSKW